MEDHVVKMLTNRIARYGSKEVIRFREKEKSALSWNELGEQVRQVMVALQSLGCEEGENVGIFSPNRAEWLIADLGIMANRCVTVPMYSTSSLEQLRYIIEEAEIRVLFVGSRDQLDTIKNLPKEVEALEMLVVFDEGDASFDHMMGFSHFLGLSREKEVRLDDKWSHYRPDDTATIIYSSGTTGEPKGVVLKHSHFVHTFRAHDKRLDIHEDDVSLSFLPLSHVFERLWTHYMLHCGVVNVFLDNPREVMSALTTVKPTLMCTVPRFFDKTYQGIRDEVGSWPVIKQKIFHWAMRSGLKANAYHSCSKKVPWFLKQQLTVADALVHKKLRDVFGGNIRLMPCAGAALNTDILKFFHAMGLFIVYGYGLTETTATVSCFRADHFKYGTCGAVMPDVEVKLGENHEILVRGENVFSGYYKKPEETETVLKDGWFHTGDEGRLDEDGHLIMVDRIKDLMKTSVGKYVSPQKLEMLLTQDELIEQVVVVGDGQPYVTALIVVDPDQLKQVVEGLDISPGKGENLTSSAEVRRLLEKRLERIQQHLPSYEKVVDFRLLDEPFSMEEGTMTNTMKLRRNTIEQKYRHVIEEMYQG